MGEFNPYDQDNTNRRLVEALENIAVQLGQIKDELRDIKENIRHKVKMENK
ncbi:MAG: hypothetical protein WCI36_01155 [bacterium]